MKYQFLIFSLSTFFFISCSSKVQEEIKVSDRHTSKISLSWTGTYKGVLPCADCEGIETTLRVNNDSTFHLINYYLGKKSDSVETFGSFSWNEEENTIILNNISNNPNKYFIGENSLLQLDLEGNLISGELADKYILKKVFAGKIEKITDITWRLLEIQGKPISRLDKNKRPIQFRLNSKENRVNGFAGCNNFWGSFNLQEGNRISFSKMASTLMACPDLHLEIEFYRILDRTDNYTLKENFLYLNKAKMASLAKFEAVVE